MKKTLSKSKKVMPTCPNCKEKHKLYVVQEKDWDDESVVYPYLLEHNVSTCPYGYENYQLTISKAVKETESFITSKFSR